MSLIRLVVRQGFEGNVPGSIDEKVEKVFERIREVSEKEKVKLTPKRTFVDSLYDIETPSSTRRYETYNLTDMYRTIEALSGAFSPALIELEYYGGNKYYRLAGILDFPEHAKPSSIRIVFVKSRRDDVKAINAAISGVRQNLMRIGFKERGPKKDKYLMKGTIMIPLRPAPRQVSIFENYFAVHVLPPGEDLYSALNVLSNSGFKADYVLTATFYTTK